MQTQLNWDMERIFKGGSDSEELSQFIDGIRETISEAKKMIINWSAEQANSHTTELLDFLDKRQTAYDNLSEASTFSSGILSANVNDSKAAKRVNELSRLGSEMSDVETLFMKKLKAVPED